MQTHDMAKLRDDLRLTLELYELAMRVSSDLGGEDPLRAKVHQCAVLARKLADEAADEFISKAKQVTQQK